MMSTNSTTEQINALLPQTQCEQCGYKGCKPYAEAMLNGEADIDLCAPGGVETLEKLATTFSKDPEPYLEHVKQNYRAPSVAVINEDLCIGCMKCIHVCPVDAIVGSIKKMHTIIKSECSGCELCIPACPMDCIELKPIPLRSDAEQQQVQQQWQTRYEKRQLRLQRLAEEKQREHLAAKQRAKKQAIAEAIARVKVKRGET